MTTKTLLKKELIVKTQFSSSVNIYTTHVYILKYAKDWGQIATKLKHGTVTRHIKCVIGQTILKKTRFLKCDA